MPLAQQAESLKTLERVEAAGSVRAVARIAGLDRSNFRLLIKRHGLDTGLFKDEANQSWRSARGNPRREAGWRRRHASVHERSFAVARSGGEQRGRPVR